MKQKLSKTIVALAVTILVTTDCVATHAGLFRNRGGAARKNESSPYNRTGAPLSRLGANRVSRMQKQDARIAARTGNSVEEVSERRAHRLEASSAGLGALDTGFSGTLGDSSPALNTFDSSSALPSNFSQQMNWNSFNLNYSTNPAHASVYE